MTFQDFLIDAIDVVLGWNISDESFADSSFGEIVRSQACMMARNPMD